MTNFLQTIYTEGISGITQVNIDLEFFLSITYRTNIFVVSDLLTFGIHLLSAVKLVKFVLYKVSHEYLMERFAIAGGKKSFDLEVLFESLMEYVSVGIKMISRWFLNFFGSYYGCQKRRVIFSVPFEKIFVL